MHGASDNRHSKRSVCLFCVIARRTMCAYQPWTRLQLSGRENWTIWPRTSRTTHRPPVHPSTRPLHPSTRPPVHPSTRAERLQLGGRENWTIWPRTSRTTHRPSCPNIGAPNWLYFPSSRLSTSKLTDFLRWPRFRNVLGQPLPISTRYNAFSSAPSLTVLINHDTHDKAKAL